MLESPRELPQRQTMHTVKSAEKGGQRLIRLDMTRAKKIKGKKRHTAVDTIGLLINFVVSPADVQDRNMIAPLLAIACKRFPSLEKTMADGGYQGNPTADDVQELAGIPLEIVKRSDTAKGFYVLPKRWIVERTYGWLNRCRRLVKDYENLSRNHAAFIILAMIRLMLRCNAHRGPPGLSYQVIAPRHGRSDVHRHGYTPPATALSDAA
jgi:transposase